MTIKRVSPEEAGQLLDTDHKYIDVRSVPEFEGEHPKGAYNIPLMHFVPGSGMSPNADFTDVFQKHFDRDNKIVLGCKSGGRSLRAAEMLSKLGYESVIDMRGGLYGEFDAAGRLVEAGWKECGLPTEQGGTGRSWEDLKK